MIAWSGYIYGLTIAPVITLFWSKSSNRTNSFLIILLYYLAASHGLIKGAGVFFGNEYTGESRIIAAIAIWVIPSLILAFPWCLLWSNTKSGYWWRVLLIIIIISIPPIGLFGWANPITAAGILFPGTKWLGLFLTILMIVLLCYRLNIIESIIALTALAITSIILNLNYHETDISEGRVSLNTNIPRIKNQEEEYFQNKKLIAQVNELIYQSKIKPKVILLPELVISEWNESTQFIWQNLNEKAQKLKITILIGTKNQLSNKEYITGLQTIGTNNQFLLDRIPVPISMWKPWSDKPTAKAYWFHNGIYQVGDKKIATLICYEQLLIWPVLHTFIYKPDIILVSSNVWWAKGTNISVIQQLALKCWSRLFKVQFLKATNS